ncbi:hypothetical protein [Glycomyces dulcitolivorans]|uniref:hypothetical protein n=1 Tax=Glycomyces dulcitolivorans TaxID=2200759 RepID=UPI000DD3B0B6|nr:hypothetical protein [Glycomyces dulcitolivorans]
MTLTVDTPSTATGRRPLLGLRIVLTLQLAYLVVGAIWLYPLLLELDGMSGDFSTADANAMTAGYVWLVVPQAAVHLLAAIQIGRTKWGGLLLILSLAATTFQIVKLMPWIVIAAPFALALLLELALLVRTATRDRIRTGGEPKRALVPELVVVPVAAAIIATLLVWNGQVNDPDNRHPERSFDGAEAPALLEEAIAEPLAVLQGVEGFPASNGHRESSIECYDRDDLDEEWSEFTVVYWFEEHIATSGPGADAVAAMRDHLVAEGWEITFDEVIVIDETIEPGHRLTARRGDGVFIEFEVADGTTLLAVHSGCVRNA